MLSSHNPLLGARALTMAVPNALSNFRTPDMIMARIIALLRSYRPPRNQWVIGGASSQSAIEVGAIQDCEPQKLATQQATPVGHRAGIPQTWDDGEEHCRVQDTERPTPPAM
jgi:hypothetical protein